MYLKLLYVVIFPVRDRKIKSLRESKCRKHTPPGICRFKYTFSKKYQVNFLYTGCSANGGMNNQTFKTCVHSIFLLEFFLLVHSGTHLT